MRRIVSVALTGKLLEVLERNAVKLNMSIPALLITLVRQQLREKLPHLDIGEDETHRRKPKKDETPLPQVQSNKLCDVANLPGTGTIFQYDQPAQSSPERQAAPSTDWRDYITDEEFDELTSLDDIDPEDIARARCDVANKVEGAQHRLDRLNEIVSRVRAGAHKPASGTIWTSDFGPVDISPPQSGYGVLIPDHGMVDWWWYMSLGYGEPKSTREVKDNLDERKRLRSEPRPSADFRTRTIH